jgi:hypothetical protein
MMLRYGRTEPRTAAGRAERDKRVQEVLRVLADRELLASQVATRLDWSDWMAGAVLDAGMATGQIARRQETAAEQLDRLSGGSRYKGTRRCWVYRATAPRAREPRSKQPPRMIFRPLPNE